MTPYQKIVQECQNRVKQESKNLMDKQYDLNQKIEDINRAMGSIVKAQDEKISKVQSDQKSLEIALENLTKTVTARIEDCFKMLDHYQTVIDFHSNYINSITRHFDERYVTQAWLGAIQIDNVKRLDSLEQSDEILESRLRNQYDILCRHIDQSADNVMKDMMGQIPCTQPILDQIRRMANEMHVNMEGFKKELERCKYNIFYGDKKLESIFTRLDKIEGAK